MGPQGGGGGDDVEIFKDRLPTIAEGPAPAMQLTLAKILYFFQHSSNGRSQSGEDPLLTWWVLAYDYVCVGSGNERVSDCVTGLPIVALRGRGHPLVFPVAAIRRQVHMYHLCPQRNDEGSDGEFHCGPQVVGGGTRAWRHKFCLASPGSNGNDRYILNEIHYTINQDTFV